MRSGASAREQKQTEGFMPMEFAQNLWLYTLAALLSVGAAGVGVAIWVM
jgi:hypothetical protein